MINTAASPAGHGQVGWTLGLAMVVRYFRTIATWITLLRQAGQLIDGHERLLSSSPKRMTAEEEQLRLDSTRALP